MMQSSLFQADELRADDFLSKNCVILTKRDFNLFWPEDNNKVIVYNCSPFILGEFEIIPILTHLA